MAQKVKSITAEIGIDSSKFTSGANAIKQSTQQVADSMTRLGGDFRQVRGSLDDLIGQYKASTPESLKYADSIAKIQLEFEKGNISSQKAVSQLEKVKAQMNSGAPAASKFADKIKTASLAIVGLNQGLELMKKIARGAQQAFEFAEAGAQIEYTKEKFDALAISIDTTATALKTDLQTATKGTLSEMEMLAGATDLMSLGLVKTHDQAVRMTTVVSQLGMDMNQLTLTLSNQTTRRFDSLGVAVDGFDDKLQGLKDSGMDVNDAFTEAFLQQAEAQVDKVGDAAESAVGSYKRWTAATSDLKDMTKQLANDGFEPLVDTIGEWLAEGNKVRAATLVINAAVKDGIILAEERRKINKETRGDDEAWILAAIEIEKKRAEEIARTTAVQERYYDEMATNSGEYVIDVEAEAEAEAELTEAMAKELEERTQMITDFNQDRINQFAELSGVIESYNDDMAESSQDLADVEAELALARSQGYAEWGTKITGLLTKQEEIKEKIQETAEAHELATKTIVLGYAEQILAADGLTEAETTALIEKGIAWGVYTEETKGYLAEILEMTSGVVSEIDAMSATITIQYVETGRPNMAGFSVSDIGLREMQQGRDLNGNGIIGRAGGTSGWETVPPGFPNDSYMVGMSSGETFNVNTAHNTANGEPSQMIEIDYDRFGQVVAESIMQAGN